MSLRPSPACAALRRLALCGLLLQAAVCVAQAPATTEHSPFDDIPFSAWSRQGKRVELPWKTQVEAVGLTYHQRLGVHISIMVDGADLVRLGSGGRMLAFVQFTDGAGKQYRDYGEINIDKVGPDLRKQDVFISWDAFVLPGEYRVALALLHQGSKRRDFVETRFQLAAPRHDPLPAAWSGLPAVEFWEPIDPNDIDAIFLKKIDGRLALPVTSPHPVRFEVLADLTPSVAFAGSRAAYNHYLAAVVPSLKTLTQLDLRNGSLALTTLDLRKSQETLTHDPARDLDWDALRRIVTSPDLDLVDARQPLSPSAAFLRQELARRIAASASDPARHLYLILSSPLDVYSFPDPDPELPRCDCSIYYLNFSNYGVARSVVRFRYPYPYPTGRPPGYPGVPVKVERMLRPLPVRSFSVSSPEDFRAALAHILADAQR